MRHRLRSLLLAIPLLLGTGCATILGGGSSQPVAIRSATPDASFTIRSLSGLDVAQGKTPQTVVLSRKTEYQLEFTAPGYQPQKIAITKGTNGWIFGNLVIGWILGFAVDFATGSAYKLQPATVDISLVQSRTAAGIEETAASVRLRDEKGRLIRELTVPLVPIGAAVTP